MRLYINKLKDKNHMIISKDVAFFFSFLCFKIFASMFISDTVLLFSFLCGISVGFGIMVMAASQNEFGSVPQPAVFERL